ncbi:hypothetical protein SAMN05216207_107810 [Pseudonocardia ammonioxydans]|uniref:Uncharacterized protein n=1 Tax=Pseudonocardia ammonioxydans TaxID=260086 RepID=A0A1I5HWL9_PSUAM|nr:hypothetical protein SAMN05216207_107810 [Pseudonocardia ammonioxydans]
MHLRADHYLGHGPQVRTEWAAVNVTTRGISTGAQPRNQPTDGAKA